jgi:CHAT domain-containing protein
MGEAVYAEGVFGLRRAFQHAGAETIIMSLFDVPDESTVSLMKRFYTNWLDGSSKSSALHQASLEMLQERRASNSGIAHPLYWGGFVLVGDPN